MQIKRTSLITKLLIIVVAAYAVITLVGLQSKIRADKAEIAARQQEKTWTEQRSEALDKEIEELGSDKSIERIARQKLGMVYEGEVTFYDIDN